MTASLIVMALMVYGGAKWWNVEAASYADDIYQPLHVEAGLKGDTLDLNIKPYVPADKFKRQFRSRANDDFLSDHNHLMHLYAIREPQMDAVFHLHPELADYVVAHEVAHLVELNHSERFWALVEWLYPHWREAKERIERDAATLPRI